MARSREPSSSLAEQLRAAGVRYTQTELAAKIGVSTRTIRRWKNEGVQPRNPQKKVAVKRAVVDARKDIVKRNKRYHAPQLHSLYPVLGERRRLKTYSKKGKLLKKTRVSDWVNYEVGMYDNRIIFEFLKKLRDQGRKIQLIFIGEATPEYPAGMRGTSIIQLYEEMEDEELLEATLNVVGEQRVLRIGVLDE